MSTASKLTLAGTTFGAIGVVIFVHWAQKSEQSVSLPYLGRAIRIYNLPSADDACRCVTGYGKAEGQKRTAARI